MLEPGSEMMNPYVINTDLHNFILEATELKI